MIDAGNLNPDRPTDRLVFPKNFQHVLHLNRLAIQVGHDRAPLELHFKRIREETAQKTVASPGVGIVACAVAQEHLFLHPSLIPGFAVLPHSCAKLKKKAAPQKNSVSEVTATPPGGRYRISNYLEAAG